MRLRPFLTLSALLFAPLGAGACGLRASQDSAGTADAGKHGLPAAPGTFPSSDTGDAGDTGDAATTFPEGDGASPSSCASGAIARLPSDYAIAGLSYSLAPSLFAVDDSALGESDDGIALEVLGLPTPSDTALAGFSSSGVFSILTAPNAATTTLGDQARMDATNVYVVETTGSVSTLYATARSTGGSTLVAQYAGSITDFVVFGGNVWLAVQTSDAAAIYVVPSTGGTLDAPFYTTPQGAGITNLAVGNSAVLTWAEFSIPYAANSPNVTLRILPNGASAPVVLTTFEAEVTPRVASVGTTTYFAFPNIGGTPKPLIPPTLTPKPPPPPPSSEDAGPAVFSTGLFSVSPTGEIALLDPSGYLPIAAGGESLFYASSAGIQTVGAGGSTSVAVSSSLGPVAFGVGAATGKFFYALVGGCFYTP